MKRRNKNVMMELFIAPKANTYQSIDEKRATALVNAGQAVVLTNGTIQCGDGFLLPILPAITKGEQRMAFSLARSHGQWKTAQAECPEHARWTKDQFYGALWIVQAYCQNMPLKLAAIMRESEIAEALPTS